MTPGCWLLLMLASFLLWLFITQPDIQLGVWLTRLIVTPLFLVGLAVRGFLKIHAGYETRRRKRL